jgi:hypothetical protein
MSDFRARLAEQLDAAAAALARGGGEVDFRARLGAQWTQAVAELQRERAAAIAPSGMVILPRAAAARRGVAPGGDFRAQFGAALTAAAAQLARERVPLHAHAGERTPARAAWARRPARDFRDRLGAQLAASAAVLAGAPAWAPASAARAASRRRRAALTGRLARPLAVGVAAMALAGGATASSLWLVSVGNPNGGHDPGLSPTSPPSAQLKALGVLRRHQTSADRGPGVLYALQDVNEFATGVRSGYVRVLESTAAGPVVLVPVATRNAASAGGGAARSIADALCIYYPVVGATPLGTTPACWSTTQVLTGAAVAVTDGRIFGLAPDNVTSVTITITGAPPISAAVAGNLFDAPLPASPPAPTLGGAPPPSREPVATFHRG